MNKFIWTLAASLVVVICASRPAHAQVIKVGSFTKSTCTAPCNQPNVAHGLGVAPKALILWTNGATLEGAGFGTFAWAIGITDGTTSRSVAAGDQNGNTSSTGTKSARRSASKVLTIVQYDTTTLAEAGFQGTNWDATNFYLQWSTNNATAYIIHFIAIGGSGVSASVVDWTAPATTGSNYVATTSLTFQPSILIHISDEDTTAPPNSPTDAAFMLGVMDAAGHQWSSAIYAKSGVTTTTQSARAQSTGTAPSGAGIVETSATATTTMVADWVSMNSNGFTVNFSTTVSGQHIFTLAMTGLNIWAGSFTNSGCTAPCNQSITGIGFQPSAVIFASWMTTASGVLSPTTNGRFELSASDNTNEGMTALDDANGRALSNTIKTITSGTEFAETVDQVDNDTTSLFQRGRIKSGVGGSFDASGFTIDWTTNSATAAEYNYLALGALGATSVTLASFTATRLPDGKVRLDWRTGYEVDNVGFRLYREQNGKRMRITSSIVPGSALMGGGRGMTVGGRTYTWSETVVTPPDGGPVQYWLEDVDLKGKSTWHGPIVLAANAPREPQ
jgi:hypothetical protein